jgi:hypothetical protein
MIIILFPAGGFGSTIEYSLRKFSNELKKIEATIMEDGSIHSYKKEFHPLTFDELLELKNKESSIEIATPIYPGFDYLEPFETIKEIHKSLKDYKKFVVIHFNTTAMAERNQLFCYYKIPNWIDTVLKDKHTQWDATYTSVNDMQIFEKREALSFHMDTLSSYLKIQENIFKDCLYITADNILYDFKNTILKIINYYELTIDDSEDINSFYREWFSKQKYILNEFDTINSILDSINDLREEFEWKPLSIAGEAIIQSRLRKQGMEIACYNLDVFPTNTTSLKEFINYKRIK